MDNMINLFKCFFVESQCNTKGMTTQHFIKLDQLKIRFALINITWSAEYLSDSIWGCAFSVKSASGHTHGKANQ